jgi:hypothetical protein
MCRTGQDHNEEPTFPFELFPRIEAAVLRHQERISSSVPSRGRDHGFSDTDEDESDEASKEMDTDSYKLRNAVATAHGGGRQRARTRGSAKFAAPFAARLLRVRGYIARPGDAVEVLEWLETLPFGPPCEELRRRLAQVC